VAWLGLGSAVEGMELTSGSHVSAVGERERGWGERPNSEEKAQTGECAKGVRAGCVGERDGSLRRESGLARWTGPDSWRDSNRNLIF
jgi:hypothetical protein